MSKELSEIMPLEQQIQKLKDKSIPKETSREAWDNVKISSWIYKL